MGLLSFFRGEKSLTASPEVVEALAERRANFLPRIGGTNQSINRAYQRGIDASYGWIYRTQPSVRSVVDYLARNVAQLGLKLYERVDDTERERREDHPAAETMANPDGRTPADAFIYRFVSDYYVYDNAYAVKFRSGPGTKLTLVRLPPEGVIVIGGRFTPELYRVFRVDGTYFDVAPEDIIHWRGYNPQDPLLGLSKLETLRSELATDAATQATLVELAKSGLKGGHIERPVDAPEWSPEARTRFQEDWRSQKRNREEPILEEGMTYVQDSITPKDAQLLEARQFTKGEVADIYGVPLAALHGEDETAEARKLVYSDVLPPIAKSLACVLDVDILQAEYAEFDFYFEFDLNEKLRGDAEARFSAITAAAGRPWLTVNEVRAMENKPPIEGGDDLTLPLNVALAGEGSPALPAPNVMPPQDPTKPPQDGSYREQPKAVETETKALPVTTVPHRSTLITRQKRAIDKATATVERFYARQERSLKSKGTKKADSERWNRELASDLEGNLRTIVELEAAVTMSRLGGDEFDMRQVENYLKAMAEGTAEGVNGATQRDIEDVGVTDALRRARQERAAVAGTSIGARATHFARIEAAKQAPGERVQTWIADTDRHSSLDGVSVSLDSDWGGITPGSEPNCACSVEVS